jgi:peptidoglycan/LPS O-acetylase OafA/YrhL
MNFRADINGLRAYAVLFVVFYHFSISQIAGGFVGVDMFFVISGYLMTKIIVSKYQKGTFSFREYYLARSVRIIPPLLVLCLLLVIFGWFFLFSFEYKPLLKHVMSSIGFFSNITYLRENGYFEIGSESKWLLHTWSLSVEWQFYLIYPIIVVVLSKFKSGTILKPAIIFLAFISFFLCVYLSYSNVTSAFFNLYARAWEMLAGGIVFFLSGSLLKSDKIKFRLEAVGWILIFSSVFLLTSNLVWPGWFALMPVLGTCFIIFSGRSNSIFLSNKGVQWLGKISYSVYLFHWPIVVALKTYSKTSLNWSIFGIFLSIILGWVSFELIERRLTKKISRFSLLGKTSALFSMLLFIGGSSLYLYLNINIIDSYRNISGSSQSALVSKYQNIITQGRLHASYREECNFFDLDTTTAKEHIAGTCVEDVTSPDILIWGDSHAQALSSGLHNSFPNLTISQIATSGCAPKLTKQKLLKANFNLACQRSTTYFLESLELLKPKVIIITQKNKHELTDWSNIAIELKQKGVENVIVIGPTPQWYPSLPLIIARMENKAGGTYIGKGLDQGVFATDKVMQERYSRSDVITYISLLNTLCHKSACLASVGEDLLVVDYGHLSIQGSQYVTDNILYKMILPLLD